MPDIFGNFAGTIAIVSSLDFEILCPGLSPTERSTLYAAQASECGCFQREQQELARGFAPEVVWIKVSLLP